MKRRTAVELHALLASNARSITALRVDAVTHRDAIEVLCQHQIEALTELATMPRGRGAPQDDELRYGAQIVATLVQDHGATLKSALRAVVIDEKFVPALEKQYHRMKAAGEFEPGQRWEIAPQLVDGAASRIKKRRT